MTGKLLASEFVTCPRCNTILKLSEKERKSGIILKCPNCTFEEKNTQFITSDGVAPKKKAMKASNIIILFVIASCFLCTIASYPMFNSDDDKIKNTSTPTPKATQNSTPTPQMTLTQEEIKQTEEAEEAQKKPHFSDGTYLVGTEIPAGTYRTRSGSFGCYYERLKGFGGTLDEIISNDNTSAPAIITISKTDKGFKSSNCGTWTQDLSQITEKKTQFGEGTYIVGVDIEAGTYKNDSSDYCYYERLRGFGGTLDDIISNENTESIAIVSISSKDKGFSSTGCGTWKKIK